MPVSATPFIVAICVVFSLVILIAGSIPVWAQVPSRPRPE